MPDWQKTVEEILLADTRDLRELAEIAGRDPKVFYRDANFRNTELSQDERKNFDLAHARYRGAPREKTDLEKLEEKAQTLLASIEGLPEKYSDSVWATLNVDLGDAYVAIGVQTGDTGVFERAVAAYGSALKFFTIETSVDKWAEIQNNLGNALRNLGTLIRDPDTLRRAIEAHVVALEVYTRERSERTWAAIQNNLGRALSNLGGTTSDADTVRRAIEAYEAALEVYTREASEMRWAMVQNNLGDGKRVLALLLTEADRPSLLAEALAHSDAAMEVITPEAASEDYLIAQFDRDLILAAQSGD